MPGATIGIDSVMFREKVVSGPTAIVEVSDEPWCTVKLAGLAVRLKSVAAHALLR